MSEKNRCHHLEEGSLAKHSTVRFETVPREDNTTTYEWDTELELCVFCSGRAYALVADFTDVVTRREEG